MSRSIRWTLLFWYALILTAALAAFGLVLHDEMERAMYRGADQEIEFWLATVVHDVQQYSPEKIGASLPDDARFVVWAAGGGVLAATQEDSDRPLPQRQVTNTRYDLRGRAERGPGDRWLWVAKDVSAEHLRIRRFLRVLVAAGGSILALGLGGGWLLVSRALRPIDRMTAAAERISSDNLTERIDAQSIQNELGRLAHTLNRTFDRLEESFERQTRFTADASHELRTPLTILLSHLELAQRKDRTVEQLGERIETCLNAARRMRSVVEGLLTLARVDAGEVQLEREPVDLAALVQETATALTPLAEEARIALEVRAEAATVHGDRERLRTAITNLMTNAIRYNRNGGRVDVSLCTEGPGPPGGSEAVLVVTDTGEGIPEEALSRIFERFYRVDETRSRERGGTGLGLAITKWIVDTHGGTLAVSSSLGEGTRVTLRLPS